MNYPDPVLNLLELLALVVGNRSPVANYFHPQQAKAEREQAGESLRHFLAAHCPAPTPKPAPDTLAEIKRQALADPRVRIAELQQRGDAPGEGLLVALGFGDALAVALADDLVRRGSRGIVLAEAGQALLARRRLSAADRQQPQATDSTASAPAPRRPDTSALVDDEIRKIIDGQGSADDKLRGISRIDSLFYAWQSPKLATLLGCTADNIRQTRWWKEDRKAWLEKEARDRDSEPPSFDEL
ncbi:MAG: hypothetical protein FJ271_09200 [Planctomycetes bacterium]|nr:hypothetical protein [Planctomycetota bacterium]